MRTNIVAIYSHRLWSAIDALDLPKQHFFKSPGLQLNAGHRGTHSAKYGWHDSLYFCHLSSDPRPAGVPG